VVGKVNLKIDVEIDKHDVNKLRRFTESANNTYDLDFMSDITEILKNTLLNAEDARSSVNFEDQFFGVNASSSPIDWLRLPVQVSLIIIFVTVI
jgi:hypothetical protein